MTPEMAEFRREMLLVARDCVGKAQEARELAWMAVRCFGVMAGSWLLAAFDGWVAVDASGPLWPPLFAIGALVCLGGGCNWALRGGACLHAGQENSVALLSLREEVLDDLGDVLALMELNGEGLDARPSEDFSNPEGEQDFL